MRFERVEKTMDGTVIYKDNLTGDTLFRQQINGRTYFIRDEGQTFQHSNMDGSTTMRRRNPDGTVYFEDENGAPMMRIMDEETGRTIFVEAEDGPVSYDYKGGELDKSTG